ncbi:MAG: type II secretion system protein [Planctomycetes bacterium]|nr:type II secretion system protein [Planctomycetota bacterium]
MAPAFTLVELLVVFAVIIVLVGAVLVAGPALIDRGKIKNTETLLAQVRDVIEQFKAEQTSNPTLLRAQPQPGAGTLGMLYYKDRYGTYPPDELEVFTAVGIPGSAGTGNRSLALGKSHVELGNPATDPRNWSAMKFYTVGNAQPQLEHRDLAAMVLTIEMYGVESKSALDALPESNFRAGPVDSLNGKPIQFLDRSPTANRVYNEETDLAVRYIVDAWGVPLSYFTTRNHSSNPQKIADMNFLGSSNHPQWHEACTEMVRLAGGEPIVMSWGPDGKEQATREAIDPNAGGDPKAVLIDDWMDGPRDRRRIDHPLNLDNLYSVSGLKEKLERGLSEE